MRLIKAIALASAALLACAAILLQASAGATAANRRAPLTYDPATQSHPGACSQNTLNVSQAVGDLSANGVLGQYAVLVGVHATGSALRAQMSQTLTVLEVASTTVTANHGCTTDGIIFPSGSRTLTAGETVGVALPGSIRGKLCRTSTVGCERELLTEHTVFPTNCWNLDQGTVQVVAYVHKPHVTPKPKPPKPKPKPKPVTKAKVKLPNPSAHLSTTCGVGNPGYASVTLSNAASATASATFDVDGKSYGPVAAGKRLTVTVALQSAADQRITVSSGGQALVDQSVPADECPAAPTAAPTAAAVLSCSVGGVVITLANGATATGDATFDVNGTTYGPLAPGASTTITVAVAPGATGQLTVTSGTETLLKAASYTNSCSAAAGAAFVGLFCSPPPSEGPGGGGVLVVQLSNGADATLPASFSVSATGTTSLGYGPTTIGPLAPGAADTLLIPVDASGNTITFSVTSGGQQLAGGQSITGGCPPRFEA